MIPPFRQHFSHSLILISLSNWPFLMSFPNSPYFTWTINHYLHVFNPERLSKLTRYGSFNRLFIETTTLDMLCPIYQLILFITKHWSFVVNYCPAAWLHLALLLLLRPHLGLEFFLVTRNAMLERGASTEECSFGRLASHLDGLVETIAFKFGNGRDPRRQGLTGHLSVHIFELIVTSLFLNPEKHIEVIGGDFFKLLNSFVLLHLQNIIFNLFRWCFFPEYFLRRLDLTRHS